MQILTAAFKNHPASVGETYGEHMRFALGFSIRLFGASCAALIHAILPFLFEKTAGQMVRRMHERMEKR